MLPATQSDLTSMMATLCSYENCFGPYHPQTLHLTATVAVACGQHGEDELAVRLLERVLRDSQRIARLDTNLRLRTATALRDLWIAREDLRKAAAVQKEVLACQLEALGAEHTETQAARSYLAMLLLDVAA